jgi:hypothetical protein
MDSKRQDRQQGTGQESKIEYDAEQDNNVLAGEGGLLSKIETGNAKGVKGQDRRVGTERRG